MANRVILPPRIYAREGNNRQELIGGELGYAEGATTWNAGAVAAATPATKALASFVVLTSQLLVPVATAGTSFLGFINGDQYHNQVTTIDPPYALKGNRHFPYNLEGMRFLMNIGRDVNGANASDIAAATLIGNQYGIFRATTTGTEPVTSRAVDYRGIQMVDISNTTQKVFTVIDVPSTVNGDANIGLLNGLVVIEVMQAALQIF